MSTAPCSLTLDDILSAVSESLVSLKGRAALDHYPSLRIKTSRINAELGIFLRELSDVSASLAAMLPSDSLVTEKARTQSAQLFYFRKVTPRMLDNFRHVYEQLIEICRPAPKLSFEELKNRDVNAGFAEFNRLVTNVRQLIDNLVMDGYQFCVLDPRELSYAILNSLLSFVVVAPACLQAPIVSDGLQRAAQAFANLSKKQRRNSQISKSKHPTFSQKVDYLGSELKPDYHHNVIGNLHMVFNFCSEFAHVGYVSTLVTSSDSCEVILGGPGDCFTPSMENYAKLKHQLLRECAIFVNDIYIPSLIRMIGQLIGDEVQRDRLGTKLQEAKRKMRSVLNETNFDARIQPIAIGLKAAGRPIEIACSCGGSCVWTSPYHEWDAYCEKCGSTFEIFETSPLNLYAMSNVGIGDVIGAAGPIFDELTVGQRDRLKLIWGNIKSTLSIDKASMQFRFLGNPDAYDDFGNSVSGMVVRVPPKDQWKIGAWVAEAAMIRQKEISIQCNCGHKRILAPPYDEQVLCCRSCGTVIGLFVISGDPGFIVGGVGDAWTLYPVCGSIYKNPQELSPAQYKAILEDMAEKQRPVDSLEL